MSCEHGNWAPCELCDAVEAARKSGYAEGYAAARLSTPANLVTVPASELRAMREEIAQVTRQRDAYKAADESMQEAHHQALTRAEDAESKLSTLLDGIEALENQLRAFDALTDSANVADDLKALREKANGSQGERGSS